MNVIFMGTPAFAVPSLQAIIGAGYNVPLVVTVPDKPKGRGRVSSPCAVKIAAVKAGLEVASPESLKGPDFLELIRSRQPDVICVVAFRILPMELYTIPKYGSFNLHGSLLPSYRGAAPINRALIDGAEVTGVTTFFLQQKVDTGNIILQRSIPVTPDMTAGELHDIMMLAGAEVVVQTLNQIASGTVQLQTQDESLATAAPKIHREDSLINWNMNANAIHNLIRGLSPRPGAYTLYHDRIIKIQRTVHHTNNETHLKPGQLQVKDEQLVVGTGTHPLRVLQVQMESKRSMHTEEFLRGFSLETGDCFNSVVRDH